MAATVSGVLRCYHIIPARVKCFAKCFFGHGRGRARPGSGRGVSSSPWREVLDVAAGTGAPVPGRGACAPVAAGVLTRTGEGVRRCAGGRAGGLSRAGGREGLRAWAWARVVLGCGCAVCGILRACACGRVVFSGAVCGAWCSLRGDGVASVVVVVWCRLVYPPNKTCNAKTSYKYAILVLACKSPCGA